MKQSNEKEVVLEDTRRLLVDLQTETKRQQEELATVKKELVSERRDKIKIFTELFTQYYIHVQLFMQHVLY